MKKLMILLMTVSLVSESCSRYYYVANVQNVPMMKEKNELHLSGSIGGGDETTCYEAQASYAATNHLGLMANFMTAKGGNYSGQNYGKGSFLEAAVGYFKPAGKYGVFEIYGGVGGCNQHHEFHNFYNGENHGYADISYMRLFLQPSFGVRTNVIDFGISGRFCNIIYSRVDNMVHGDWNAYSRLMDLQQMVPFNFEPAATLRIGWKNLKAQAQLEYAGLMNNSDFFLAEEWHISLGISVNFSAKARSK